LIYSPAHFTWMDTNHPAATPRQGYPVEIQALWIAALRFAARHLVRRVPWAAAQADRAQASLDTLFWLPGRGITGASPSPWLADCLRAEQGTSAAQAVPEDALRPNQLLAVTLGALADPRRAEAVVRACECLLVPGGIRSLADRPVATPLPVWRDGALLNDPAHPYWGSYRGDEDTRRKPAYHNGTAWTWQFPLYVEALLAVYGPSARDTARALLGSASELLNAGCAGQIPEILDGDAPHAQRGCPAQAWGVSELLRVWALSNSNFGEGTIGVGVGIGIGIDKTN
jgi:predicted glycogen debranching enzyme